MMPFLYPIRPTGFPVLVVSNQTHVEDNDDDDDDDEMEDEYLPLPTNIFPGALPIPLTALSHFVNVDGQIPPPIPIHNDDQGIFRLRMNVDGFQPNELNVSIRHGRLIVRGKHVVRAQIPSSQPLTTNSVINGNDDTEPDFVAKEFKRTFTIPPNADVRKAHAQFYPQQQLLVIEMPFQNLTNSSQIRIHRERIRPMDIFLTIITILLMDRALRIAYEQFMINEHSPTNTSSQYRNNTRREDHDIFS
jgi:HSP20 family molecular chaperone IbpA